MCVCWFVFVLVFDLVLGIKVGVGWCPPGDGVFDIHVDDFVGILIVLRHCGVRVVLLVHKKDLWSSQGRLERYLATFVVRVMG